MSLPNPSVELRGLTTDKREYEPLQGGPPPPEELHLDLVGAESFELEAISNLDNFFTRVYRYYVEKGFCVMVVSRVLNVCALAFIAVFSGTLLLIVDWDGLHAPCIVERKCDILEVAFHSSPLWDHAFWWTATVLAYLGLLGLYLLWSIIHLVEDLRDASEIRHFYRNRLGISDHAVATMTWPEVLKRIVLLQQHIRLCIVRDLTSHDICARIMRRDNFLIGMLNKGVLALNVPFPGLRKRVMLTKLMEWNLRYCLLDAMFDKNFLIKHSFKHKPEMLARRFRIVALINLIISPFLVAFLVIYFFMRNAEKFYHHPSSAAARNWTPYAKWRLREFNEMEHLLHHRLSSSRDAASEYIAQFPTPVIRQVARFTAFVSGSFAALVLFLAAVNDVLMERHLAGHNLVWWAACLGVVLAVSRGLIGEGTPVFDPEEAMAHVVRHTHYMPRHWRGRAHTREVQEQLESMFCLKALLFVEELASVFFAPFVMGVVLPKSAEAITEFIRNNSINVSGLGDVCSLAQFDLDRHGSIRYGGPPHVSRRLRSSQGKMEKSLVSFASTYNFWEPVSEAQKRLLQTVACYRPNARVPAEAVHAAVADSCGAGWSYMDKAAARNPHRRESQQGQPEGNGWDWQQAARQNSYGSIHDNLMPPHGSHAGIERLEGVVAPPENSHAAVASSQTALQVLYDSFDNESSLSRSRFCSCLANIESRAASQHLSRSFSGVPSQTRLVGSGMETGSASSATSFATAADASFARSAASSSYRRTLDSSDTQEQPGPLFA